MTTIVAHKKGRIMLADSMVVDQGIKSVCSTKLRKINGDLIGFAGSLSGGLLFLEWYAKSKKTRPSIQEDFVALVLTKSKQIIQYEASCIAMPVEEEYYAIGTGANYALAVMDVGGSPEDAIRIAAKRDIYSGLPIHHLKL